MNNNFGQKQRPPDEAVTVKDFNALFPKEHLTAPDLLDRKTNEYRNFNMEIASVKMRSIWQQATNKFEKKGVVYFKGAEKYLILNHEICEALAEITGQVDPNAWVGHVVNVFVFKNRRTPQGLKDVPRVRPAIQNQTIQNPPEQPQDEAPAFTGPPTGEQTGPSNRPF